MTPRLVRPSARDAIAGVYRSTVTLDAMVNHRQMMSQSAIRRRMDLSFGWRRATQSGSMKSVEIQAG